MEQKKHICASICDGLPTLSAHHPWLVDHAQHLVKDGNRDDIVYTTRDPLSQNKCRIPSFLGRRIWGCFYGWVILSNHPHNDMWSIWNPLTSKIIRLPRLIPKNGDRGLNITQQFCLSAPPNDHGSIFMLTTKKLTIVFCRLDCKRKRFKWVEMSYAKQTRSITGSDGLLYCMTSCNGKVYALYTSGSRSSVVHIDIVVKGREIAISIFPYLECPSYYMNGCWNAIPFLQGCCTELFYVELGLTKVGQVTEKTVGGVCVFKLDMTNMRWEEMEDIKDGAFFLDLAHGFSIFYSPTICSDLGGYVHFLHVSGKVIHSYNFKNKTIALSSMPTPRDTSLWEDRYCLQLIMCTLALTKWELFLKYHLLCWLQGHIGENEMVVRDDAGGGNSSTGIEDENMESPRQIPFDVLTKIMEFCIGVEYLNFRATCKQCHLAAPVIRWSNGGRLQTYSLVSPWLMVLDKDQGVTSFTDPISGDKYFIKTPRELIGNVRIYCSMYGWLLIQRHLEPLMFFNPFTSDIRELPHVPYLDSYYFSAPPTSSDCMVVGFTTYGEWHVYIHFVAQEPSWRRFHLNFSGDGSQQQSFYFATRYDRNIYSLYYNGGLGFIDIDNQDYNWREGPRSSCGGSPKQNFLMKCDQELLQVIMSEFGERVEVFKLNNDSTEWDKTESLGRHAIYICGEACLCIEAKMPEMANKIYFPRVHSENRKIVFYSLETRRYHTSNVEESFGDFRGTEHHINPHVWIQPSWS